MTPISISRSVRRACRGFGDGQPGNNAGAERLSDIHAKIEELRRSLRLRRSAVEPKLIGVVTEGN